MEPSAKRRCLETDRNNYTATTQLTSLNDDCIFKIFEYLDLNQLTEAAKTCKKLNELADTYFQQRFKNKVMAEVKIQVTRDGELVLLPYEDYVYHFLQYMQNVRLCDGFSERPLDVLNFMRNHCHDNLITVAFERQKFQKLHGALIVDWLSTVEGLAFFGRQYLHEILEYCSNLKYLKIDRYSKDERNQWMACTYPKLVRLLYYSSPNDRLIAFLINNPNVKSLMLRTGTINGASIKNLMHRLRELLQELLISLRDTREFDLVKDELKSICNSNNFERLDLCLENTRGAYNSTDFADTFGFLAELNHLTGLHILQCDRTFPTNVTLEHLKVLQLAYVSGHISTTDLPKNLPNLKELYLMCLSSNFQDLVAPFARNAAKLTKIVARDFKIAERSTWTNFCLAKHFNDERERLANACKLVIYIGKDEFDESLDATNPNLPLVQIRRVEFQKKETNFLHPFLECYEF